MRPWKHVPKMWGREVIFYDGEYCAKLLVYNGPYTSSKHYHEHKHESFCVVEGEFQIDWYMLDDKHTKGSKTFNPGDTLVLFPRTVHRVKCLSQQGGKIFEASSSDAPDDCVRLEPSINPFG
jgi:mannose-6-phosphate isomerase-like protein (cupin superfamily)